MDERKYWAFRVRSSPDAIKQRIAHLIAQNSLRERIPSMYCEKVSMQRGVREFYFFLNITVDDDDTPFDILGRPDLQTIARPFVEEAFTYDQIKSMTGREVELESIKYARHIAYRPPEISRPDNPFDFAMSPEPNDESLEAYNHLLYWMSGVGKGTWQGFREACKSLGLSDMTEPRHIFRRLRLLGHAEYLNAGTHWITCPSCMVRVSDHGARYFLSGAQVPDFVAKFQEFAHVEVETKGNYGGPESVFVTFSSDVEAQNLSIILRKVYPYFRYAGVASAKLADILPDLNDWYLEVLSSVSVVSERYSLDKWDGKGFGIPVAHPTETGMYRLISLENQESDLHYYFYFDPDRNCWLEGDWYGLRFLANHHLGSRAEFNYESNLRQLYVPNIHHLPDLYERALVLASGRLPVSARSGLVYENIDNSLAETISSKLYAELNKGI
jgi:hypothetical protein